MAQADEFSWMRQLGTVCNRHVAFTVRMKPCVQAEHKGYCKQKRQLGGQYAVDDAIRSRKRNDKVVTTIIIIL